MSTTDNSKIDIRRIMRKDIDTVLALDRKIGRGESSISFRDLMITDPGGPLDFSFVYEYEGKVVGFILSRLEYLGIPLIATCVIKGIAVDPEFRKQGIGSELVNKVLDRCYDEGISKARALINEEDTDLSRMFRKLNFKHSKVINYDVEFDYVPSEPSTRQW